jgi:hypothetical protein
MTDEQQRVIRELRNEGCAVIVWTPEELEGASAKHVQDRSIEVGWSIIDALKSVEFES